MAEIQRRRTKPQPGPQTEFLSNPADICIYGGAAGGGKSWSLLVDPLRHIKRPGFGAVIFRRTSPQITNEGGLWDESMQIYPLFGGVPKVGTLDWEFPEWGTNIGFRHLQHEADKLAWQGSQVPWIGFDELTHFLSSQFFYMLSRNRTTCGVRPCIRAGTNPEPGWVRDFLAPWISRAHPLKAASGEIRWFVRVAGEIVWAHAHDELKARFPTLIPKSVSFVRASVYDNKILLAKNPEYLGNLQALNPVDRARLLDGDWDVKHEGLVYPDFSSCIVPADTTVPEGTPVGGIDFGWNNPFAALAAVIDHDDVLWIRWERYGSKTAISEHSAHLPRNDILWWADPAGADQIAELRRADHRVVPCVHLGDRPVMTGIDRVTNRIRTGRLKVLETCTELIREADLYRYDPAKLKEEPIDADNHALAALRYLIVGLDRNRAIEYTPPEQADEEAAREAEMLRQAQADWLRPDNPFLWQ